MEVTSPELEELRYGIRRYLSVKMSYAPQFSPDDKRLAYLSDITGVPQLWSVGLEEGAWPQQLSLGQERIGFLSYAKKNEMIAYGVDSGGDEKYQIRVIEDGGERMGVVTDDPETIHGWGDWSPDERSVCYSSNARSRSFFDIYVYSLDTGNPQPVFQQDGNNFPVSWSPDGSTIMFERAHAPFNQDLYLLHLGDRSVEHITPHDGDAAYYSPTFDPTGRFVYCVTDEGREFSAIAKINIQERSLSYLHTEEHDVESLALTRDGNRIAFTVNEDGFSRLMVWRVGSESPEKIDVPRSVLGGLSWSNDGRRLAFSLSSSKLNSDVWVYDVESQSVRRVTRSSTCGIPESSFADGESFRFKSFDGLEVPAFLYRPLGTGPSPLLVYLHGGPESQFRPSFNPLLQFLVKMGFAVLAPNFRGSVGYGRMYTHLDDVRGRMDTVRDAISAVTEARKMVSIDPRKIVAWGGSYGGFMVLACLYTKPELWAAGVDIVGISNFVTFLNNTSPWRRKLRIPEYGDPEKDKDFLEGISPTNNAQYITAPLFVIHGVNDPRVPIGEAAQIMETMQRLGREAHIMTFQDEGHGLVKLQNRIDGYTNAVGFLMYQVTVAGQRPLQAPESDSPG